MDLSVVVCLLAQDNVKNLFGFVVAYLSIFVRVFDLVWGHPTIGIYYL